MVWRWGGDVWRYVVVEARPEAPHTRVGAGAGVAAEARLLLAAGDPEASVDLMCELREGLQPWPARTVIRPYLPQADLHAAAARGAARRRLATAAAAAAGRGGLQQRVA